MLISKKIKKFFILGIFIFSLFISIFSFVNINKVKAQVLSCPPNYILNGTICTSIFPGVPPVTPISGPTIPVIPANKNTNIDGTYKPLAPLPGFDAKFDFTDTCPLGRYLNITINLIIGLIAVMAMVMIVMGGIEYMTSELVSGKANGKSTIMNAIFGLLIALSSYLILNTLNPNLLNLCLDGIPKTQITITDFDSGDSIVDPDYAKGKRIYSQNTDINPAITGAQQKLKDGWSISKIIITQDGKMQLELKKGNQTELTGKTNTAKGLKGYTPSYNAEIRDKKTPLGTFKIGEIRYTPGQAQFSSKGSNMGAAFWELTGLGATGRGIGIHGNKNGTLSDTNGCIRLTNADILALQPYIKKGTTVIIK